MYLLECFKKASGLKVNYHKSNLYGVGINNNIVEELATWCSYQAGNLPFMYLGLPVGSKMKKVNDWSPVIEKFNNRLPLYYFSLFRAPPCVLKILESVRRHFFWGGSGSNSKMSWVKWDTILLPHEEGGLNIMSLKSKKLALLCKWWWRFKTETNTLWITVIRSIYGSNGGLVLGDGLARNSNASLWSSICDAGKSVDDLGINFSNSFTRKIGNVGEYSFFG
ncbi:uncharacterized protein [Rutidosis leptorrhynchoides]|uniref:uncharacterized protein n=1 Tax=Rutidosis leptorrhynchoides TaxID=125765 RepID=UPI003A9A18EF